MRWRSRARRLRSSACSAPPAISARGLGSTTKWLLQALKAGGNYGEIFERNVGQASPLKLARGLNATWSKGGLMHPFRSNSRLCKGSTAARGPAPPGTVAARS